MAMTATGGVVEYEVKDHIALARLNRPEQMNAQNIEMRKALVQTWHNIDTDPEVWVAILTGNGKAFSAGHDLKEQATAEELRTDPGTHGVYAGLMSITKPVLAAINGPCLAQGAGVALLSDIRIAADDAVFGWPQVKRGISSVSGPAILCRVVPENIAFEYLFTGEFITAQEALRWGLINRVCPKAEVLDQTFALARKILENAPLAVRSIKEAHLRTKNVNQIEAFALGEAMAKLANQSEDAKEGLAAFAEKRPPVGKGR